MQDRRHLTLGNGSLMSVGQGPQDTDTNRGDVLPGRRLFRQNVMANVAAQIDALDPFHHQVIVALFLDKIVHVGDVGARERRSHPSFLGKHGDVEFGLLQMVVHLLDRHGALEADRAVLDRPPDNRHAAFAGDFDQFKLAAYFVSRFHAWLDCAAEGSKSGTAVCPRVDNPHVRVGSPHVRCSAAVFAARLYRP